MRIFLSAHELRELAAVGIGVDIGREYDDEEALDIADQVYDIEVRYAQDADTDLEARHWANVYAMIADKIRQQVPEERSDKAL